jgi:tight adherence protein B
MRRALTALLVIAAFVPAAPAFAARFDIAPAGHTSFPDKAYTLTLPPGANVGASQVSVTENSRGVSAPSLVPASNASSDRFGVVLVIDTSTSMRGGPLKAAMAAAREFADQRNPRQKVGIVLVNRTATVALEPTADAGALDIALSEKPEIAGGTRLYNGVQTALDELAKARISAGSVIVLSDGADNGSATSVATLTSHARAQGVRLYAVGLRNKYLDRGALNTLATGGRGRFVVADSEGDLNGIFRELAAQIKSQYLLSYKSVLGPGERVHVAVSIDAFGTASDDYKTPALTRGETVKHSLWTSGAVIAAVSVGCALLVGLVFLTLLLVTSRRRSVQVRVADFMGGGPDLTVTDDFAHQRAAGLVDGAERSLARTEWWAQFKEDVEIARIEKPAVNIALGAGAGSCLLLFVLTFATGNLLVGLVAALVVPALVRMFVRFKVERQRRLFAEQLADNLQVIASAMRAGNSFAGALAVAVEDAAEPARAELRRAVVDERLGVPFDEALKSVARRMDNRDLTQVVLVASLQRETGGNTAEILDRVAETIRERIQLRRFVRTITAQGRLTRWVVTALPVVLALAISALQPNYLDPLLHTGPGHALLVLGIVLVTAGSLTIKKIVNIKV